MVPSIFDLYLFPLQLIINPLKESELIVYGGEFYNGKKVNGLHFFKRTVWRNSSLEVYWCSISLLGKITVLSFLHLLFHSFVNLFTC